MDGRRAQGWEIKIVAGDKNLGWGRKIDMGDKNRVEK